MVKVFAGCTNSTQELGTVLVFLSQKHAHTHAWTHVQKAKVAALKNLKADFVVKHFFQT